MAPSHIVSGWTAVDHALTTESECRFLATDDLHVKRTTETSLTPEELKPCSSCCVHPRSSLSSIPTRLCMTGQRGLVERISHGSSVLRMTRSQASSMKPPTKIGLRFPNMPAIASRSRSPGNSPMRRRLDRTASLKSLNSCFAARFTSCPRSSADDMRGGGKQGHVMASASDQPSTYSYCNTTISQRCAIS